MDHHVPQVGGNLSNHDYPIEICGSCKYHVKQKRHHCCAHPSAATHECLKGKRYIGEYDLLPRWCPVGLANHQDNKSVKNQRLIA